MEWRCWNTCALLAGEWWEIMVWATFFAVLCRTGKFPEVDTKGVPTRSVYIPVQILEDLQLIDEDGLSYKSNAYTIYIDLTLHHGFCISARPVNRETAAACALLFLLSTYWRSSLSESRSGRRVVPGRSAHHLWVVSHRLVLSACRRLQCQAFFALGRTAGRQLMQGTRCATVRHGCNIEAKLDFKLLWRRISRFCMLGAPYNGFQEHAGPSLSGT